MVTSIHPSIFLRLSGDGSQGQLSEQGHPEFCGRCTDPPVNLTLHPSLTSEQDPKILELLHLRQELSPNSEGASHLFQVENHGLRLGGADFHLSCFTLSCKLPQNMLEVLARRSQQDNIVCKKQRWNPLAPEPDPLWPPTAPKNSVHKNNEQNWWQRAALLESNMHREQVWLTAGNANQAPAPVLQGPYSPSQRASDPVLPEHLPQNATRDTVECLLQVHKTHVDWLGRLPWTLKHPVEGIELVQCSMARTKTALFLLNLRFDYRPNSPLQYPGVNFPREAE